MKVFIVMPVFNEEKMVEDVLKKIAKTSLPVIVIDDGSIDGSKKKIEKLNIKNLILLSHRVNLGKGAAMKTGAEYAFKNGADAVVFMDSDGQHEIGDIKAFLEKLKNGYDVVFGSRNLNYGIPLVRFLGNKFASVLVSALFGIYVSDLLSGYRAITKRAYKRIKWESLCSKYSL